MDACGKEGIRGQRVVRLMDVDALKDEKNSGEREAEQARGQYQSVPSRPHHPTAWRMPSTPPAPPPPSPSHAHQFRDDRDEYVYDDPPSISPNEDFTNSYYSHPQPQATHRDGGQGNPPLFDALSAHLIDFEPLRLTSLPPAQQADHQDPPPPLTQPASSLLADLDFGLDPNSVTTNQFNEPLADFVGGDSNTMDVPSLLPAIPFEQLDQMTATAPQGLSNQTGVSTTEHQLELNDAAIPMPRWPTGGPVNATAIWYPGRRNAESADYALLKAAHQREPNWVPSYNRNTAGQLGSPNATLSQRSGGPSLSPPDLQHPGSPSPRVLRHSVSASHAVDARHHHRYESWMTSISAASTSSSIAATPEVDASILPAVFSPSKSVSSESSEDEGSSTARSSSTQRANRCQAAAAFAANQAGYSFADIASDEDGDGEEDFSSLDEDSDQEGSVNVHSLPERVEPVLDDAPEPVSDWRFFQGDTISLGGPASLRLATDLPSPTIRAPTDPHRDFRGHLSRHGLGAEADAYAPLPPDYVLHTYMTAISGGPPVLLEQSAQLLVRHESEVARQMSRSTLDEVDPGQQAGSFPPDGPSKSIAERLPESLYFDVEHLDPMASQNGVLPTHILALHPSEAWKDIAPTGMLLPVHSLPYVLQCVSLPPLPPSDGLRASIAESLELPVVSVQLPRPDLFPMTHRFLYTRDPLRLLADLLPIQLLTKLACQHGVLTRQTESAASQGEPEDEAEEGVRKLGQSVELLTQQLSQPQLLDYADKVRGCWLNGCAVGFVPQIYWTTLSKAWDFLIASLEIQKRQRLSSAGSQQQQHTATDDPSRANTLDTFHGAEQTPTNMMSID